MKGVRSRQMPEVDYSAIDKRLALIEQKLDLLNEGFKKDMSDHEARIRKAESDLADIKSTQKTLNLIQIAFTTIASAVVYLLGMLKQ